MVVFAPVVLRAAGFSPHGLPLVLLSITCGSQPRVHYTYIKLQQEGTVKSVKVRVNTVVSIEVVGRRRREKRRFDGL